jgi:amino acid adenylation domain-containing protein
MASAVRTFPLTTVERRFWLLHYMHPEAPIANIGRVVDLDGPLDPQALARAFATVAAHPLLRMRVTEVDGEPRAHLGTPPVLHMDPKAIQSDDDVAAVVDAVVKAPYDLQQGPLFRARLVRRGPNKHVLVLGAHHLILDGWGLSRSLPQALTRALRGEAVDIDTDDVWIAARARADAGEADGAADHDSDRDYWNEQLKTVAPLSLPLVRPPPPRSSGRAFDVEVPLERSLFARAEALAQLVGARPVHVFLAAFSIELARSSRTNELLIGTTRATRPATSLATATFSDDDDMGCFVRTKPLKINVEPGASFRSVVGAARAAVRNSLEHAAFDAEELHTISAPPMGALFNYIPFPAFDGHIAGVDIDGGRIIAGGTAFPISLTVDEKGKTPRIVVEVDADTFDAGFAERFAERVKCILDDGLLRPDIPYERLRRIGPTDRQAIDENAPTAAERAHIVGGHLGRAVADDLVRHADRDALIKVSDPRAPHLDEVISRSALLARARRIAHSLRQHGKGPGDMVGVACLNPLRTVEAIFGVLFSGAAYVPIDPAAPEKRRAAIIQTAKLDIVIDDADATIRADVRANAIHDDAGIVDAIPGSDADPAYAIFTSGSTGIPKGVVISHGAVMAQLQAREALGFPHVDRSMLLAPFFFDGSIETLFWSFTTGGVMHVLGEEGRRDPVHIREALSRRRITYTSAVPALWGAMLDAAPAHSEPLDALGFVIVGGEKLTPQLIEKHNTLTTAWLVNEYGPTESTVFSSAWSAPKPGSPVPERVPIGRSAPHVLCAVVDESLQLVPALEPGELIVSGPGLADGYLGDPEQTANAFVWRDDDRVIDGAAADGKTRVYRTGDIVRLWPDGQLEWLARRDEQVKLRGLRVEPGEVEAAIMAEGHVDAAGVGGAAVGIVECAVIVDGQSLLAYVTPAHLREEKIIKALQARLPEAMVPARIIALDTLPKTANDKIDKKALPRVTVDEAVVAPATDTEREVAAEWADVLGLDTVSVTRTFFQSGGHSLKAAILVRRLSARCQVDVTLSSLMVARTIRELAAHIDGRRASSSSSSTPTAASLLLPLSSTSSSSSPRVVFLPGIGGHVFTFLPIAERMQATSIGLRTYGGEPGEEPISSIEDLARSNLEALDAFGVDDDVVFAGYSFGGLVAYEMALQRSAVGRPPRHLMIFDTMAPGYPKKLPMLTRAKLHVENLMERDWAGRAQYFKDRADSVREKFNLRFQRADAFAEDFGAKAEDIAALDPAQRAQLERLAGVSTLAHHAYWPRSSSSVPLLLFAAERGFDWAATRMDDPLLGWRSWCSGHIERVELKGDHLKLFMDENIALMAKTLDAVASSTSESSSTSVSSASSTASQRVSPAGSSHGVSQAPTAAAPSSSGVA